MINIRNQTTKENFSPSETSFEESKVGGGQPYSLDNIYIVETDPGLVVTSPTAAVWLQETMNPYYTYFDVGNGLWDNLIMDKIIYNRNAWGLDRMVVSLLGLIALISWKKSIS